MLRITDTYDAARFGESLSITTDGRGGAVTAYSALDQISAAAERMRRLRRQVAVIAGARRAFSARQVQALRAEARWTLRCAEVSALRAVVALRAFVC